MDEIKVNCKAADTLDIQDMTLFQGELKTRTDADYEHIKKSIIDYGFCAPFFIWEHDGINSVLDGTGRYETLQRMKSDGYDVPLLPVAYIDCKDEATAKKVLLQINSHNGTMTVDSVRDFLGDVEFNFGDITLPDSGALDFTPQEEHKKPEDINKIKLTDAEIDTEILQYDNFYFAYSGGRDSTLALAKTWPLLKRNGKHAEALYVESSAEFPDLLPYIRRITDTLEIPLTVLPAKKTFFGVYGVKKIWPDAIFMDCIENLINYTTDAYCNEKGEKYVLIRGGRSKQKSETSKSNKIQRIEAKPLMTIFNPIYNLDQKTYDEEIAKLPLWRGYEMGFERTACWCCPFQKQKQWEALKNNYPFLWEELKIMMNEYKFKLHEGDGHIKYIRDYWGDVKTC